MPIYYNEVGWLEKGFCLCPATISVSQIHVEATQYKKQIITNIVRNKSDMRLFLFHSANEFISKLKVCWGAAFTSRLLHRHIAPLNVNSILSVLDRLILANQNYQIWNEETMSSNTTKDMKCNFIIIPLNLISVESVKANAERATCIILEYE